MDQQTRTVERCNNRKRDHPGPADRKRNRKTRKNTAKKAHKDNYQANLDAI